jgi:hypothetical protein
VCCVSIAINTIISECFKKIFVIVIVKKVEELEGIGSLSAYTVDANIECNCVGVSV